MKGKFCHLRLSGTSNRGILNFIAGYFWGGKTPLHKPYAYSLYYGEDSSIWMVPEMFGDFGANFSKQPYNWKAPLKKQVIENVAERLGYQQVWVWDYF